MSSIRIPARLARRATHAAAATVAGLTTLAALGACRSADLTETPPTFISPSTFYKTDADAVSAINGAYQPLMDWNLWRQPAWISLACDDDEMQCQNWMGGGFNGNQAGQWYISRPWTGDYQIIARANDVLGNVPGASGISAATKTRTVGQAYFIRGYAYFDLVRRFGAVPLRDISYTPSNAAGAMARSPLDSVYHAIVIDLKRAADSLPMSYAEAAGGGRPTPVSAWGLLAKVYLHMAGAEVTGTPLAANKAAYLDSARIYAQKVMTSGQTALEPNYYDLFDVVKQNTSKEILFAVEAATAGVQGSQLPGYYAPTQYSLAGGGSAGFIGMRRDFYGTFAKSDKRVAPNLGMYVHWQYTTSSNDKGTPAIWADSLPQLGAVKDSVTNYGAWTEGCGYFGQDTHMLVMPDAQSAAKMDTAKVVVASTIFINKYIDPNGQSSTGNSNNPIILRYADVLLMYAEAENALNGPANAYSAINQVRARAGVPALTPGLSQAQFAESVYVERKHELFAEFQTRFDMVRLGRYLTDMNKPPRDGSSTAICRPRQAYQILFPLPDAEISGNPLIHQNPGY